MRRKNVVVSPRPHRSKKNLDFTNILYFLTILRFEKLFNHDGVFFIWAFYEPFLLITWVKPKHINLRAKVWNHVRSHRILFVKLFWRCTISDNLSKSETASVLRIPAVIKTEIFGTGWTEKEIWDPRSRTGIVICTFWEHNLPFFFTPRCPMW